MIRQQQKQEQKPLGGSQFSGIAWKMQPEEQAKGCFIHATSRGLPSNSFWQRAPKTIGSLRRLLTTERAVRVTRSRWSLARERLSLCQEQLGIILLSCCGQRKNATTRKHNNHRGKP